MDFKITKEYRKGASRCYYNLYKRYWIFWIYQGWSINKEDLYAMAKRLKEKSYSKNIEQFTI